MKKPILGLVAILISMAPGALSAKPRAGELERYNKAIILQYYNTAFNLKDYAKASQIIGDHYIQHNTNAADGKEGMIRYVKWVRDNHPNASIVVKQVFADNDFVILHSLEKFEPGDRGKALVDIFKLSHGKIVEHWDVIQDIPAQAANNNSMF